MENKQRFQYAQAKRRENIDSRKSPRKSSFGSYTETHEGRNNSLASRLLRSVSCESKPEGPTDWVEQWNSQSNNIPAVPSHEESSGRPMQLKCKSGWTARDWVSPKSESQSLQRRKSVPSSLETSADLESEMSSLKHELLRLRSDNTLLCNHITLQFQSVLSDKKSPEELESGDDTSQSSADALEIKRLNYEYEFKAQVANMLRSTIAKLKSRQSSSTLTQGIKSLLSKNTSQQLLLESQETLYERLSPTKSQHSNGSTGTEYEISRLENHLKLLVDALEDERQINHELVHENEHLKSKMTKLKSSGKSKNGMHSLRRR